MNAKLGKTAGMRWLAKLGLGGVMLVASACGQPAEPSAPATAAEAVEIQQRATVAPIGKTIWLRAGTNGKIVSADRNINGNAPLVANRDAPQGWEKFVVGSAGGDYITLRVQETGAYVSADPNNAGELTGFRTAVGEWEQFLWVDFGNGSIGLKAKSTGKFVVTDTNRGAQAPLFADRATAGQWESFTWGAEGGGTTPPPSGSGWVQVWSDEFDGTSVNTSNWAPNTTVHVNNEQQQYTNSSENVQVSNGTLKLIARYKPTNGYPYTSGRLESAGKREFSHGAVEARIKLPVGPGLWPAFWMLGNDIGSKGWPACGELDIMENVGYGDWTSGALHGPGYSGNTPINAQFKAQFVNNPISNWHTYRTEYSSADIKWFIDGQLVKTVLKSEVTRYGAYVYDHPFYIILNLAVGGGYPQGVNGATYPYPGVPQSTADLIARTPQVMEVDYVRAFQWR
ncbi:glycoside hydrolase family 16 protein [Archangium primigenium]|uniref:glycoside hydrolase family 16 protein n=1 Tax=[Archangium] primigenium TaxID=2792470 RepID=UPI00195A46AE|nr:glycoside hydrolase family 16 protein [Archangium primigenium]MBM7117895.1 glycoside hydrolase family 16 protein [Archangium primigenium]